jgi:DNA-binding transcriptional MerR regulator
MEIIDQYRRAGLPLADIARLLSSDGDDLTRLLESRLRSLNDEIQGLRYQQKLIVRLIRNHDSLPPLRLIDKDGWVSILRAAGMSDTDMERWHVEFERQSPEAHQDFLESLGLDDAEIGRIRESSRSAWSEPEAKP